MTARSQVEDALTAARFLTTTTAETFEHDVLHAEGLMLVDFWASYCGVCQTMRPVLEALAEEFSGRVSIVMLDVEAHPDVADRYGVRTLPTLILFDKGKQVGQATGAIPHHTLAVQLRAALVL